MHDAHAFLQALAIVLCVAAVTTVVFQRLRQPVVLGYIIAGLIIGPHVPIPLVADAGIVQTLSELGVILLMFSLGLEFSLRKLIQVGPTAGITAIIQCSVMVWLGFITGRAFGWTRLECLFAGAAIAISSTTIIAKAFDEQNIRGNLRKLVIGILVVEDIIAILLMATLTAVSSGAGLSAGALAVTVGKLVAFLIELVVVGLLVVPRAVRAIVKLNRPETTLVASVGICFAVALLAQTLGYSVALGAFLAGSLVSESGEGKTIEHLVQPVRDIFAAIFFVSVGMLLDPVLVAQHWGAVVVLTLVVVFGKILSVTLGAFLTGNGMRTSVQAGMSLAQIGEFSFIIAGLGLSLKATGSFLYPVAVAVSVVTTLVTPWLIKASGPFASLLDRKLPQPLQTFVTLYGSWVERLGNLPRRETVGARARRSILLLLVDAALLVAIVVGASIGSARVVNFLVREVGLLESVARTLFIVASVVLCVPFAVGIVRVARRLGVTLAEAALPAAPDGKVDLAAAPRRMLVVTLQLGIVVIVGVPVMALTQPFLPGLPGATLLLIMIAVLGFSFWRSATNLQGHMRAGAQVIVAALAAQSHATGDSEHPEENKDSLADIRALLPGMGDPESISLIPTSPAVGRTLAELDLRGMTGATVLAIRRGDADVLVPTAQEVLRAGDVLALAGTHEAIDAARAVLEGGGEARAEVAEVQ
ncbi:potassium transporter [Corallococcus sp. H22C18031201]|uniref:cation:proton antiporter n=1 Tax=Citreicoccus inhibens TaxID=2849499 RepID=UPI000E7511BC|nr:cation:proton antiporter [Citreicoccus inhibens]MBU8894614.1 cation:proton antiporter [Citreicoccus inhibens]RJS25201.1 potassium transporter [Corallococcus sp. H22C18031201]